MALGLAVRLGLWISFRADSIVHLTGFLSAVGVRAVNDFVEFLYLAIPLSILVTLTRQGSLSRRGGGGYPGTLLRNYLHLSVLVDRSCDFYNVPGT